MSENDTPNMQSNDLVEALGLLTRIPVSATGKRGARASWAWPLAGAVVALLAVATGWIGLAFGLSSGFVAGLVLTVQIMATGAMHEDGLADCADGFWGATLPEKRLAIMKDSTLGTYGVTALILSVLVRWSAVVILIESGWLFGGLLAAAVLSRVPMVALMHALEPAREDGLSQDTGRPDRDAVLLAAALAAVVALLGAGFAALPAIAAAVLLALAFGRLAQHKIGGQTGDVLGAAQQICEIGALGVLSALA